MFKFTGILLLLLYKGYKREVFDMTKIYAVALLSMLFAVSPALAADDMFALEEDDLFADDTSAGKTADTASATAFSFLSSRIPESTAKNINKAEKVFCYTVDYAPAGYEGYVINDLAVKGACGELSQTGKDLIKKSVFDNNSLYSSNKDSCNISPKIILRYVYGPDYTDVLFSSPCQSLTFFHGGDITTVNAAPGAAIVDQIVKAYSGLEEPYQSPALLGQMVGNGQVMNQRDKEVLRRAAPTEAPLKKWNTEQQPVRQNQTGSVQPAKSGWNKLR